MTRDYRISTPSFQPAAALSGVRPIPIDVGTFDLIDGDGSDNFLSGTANADTMRGFDGNDSLSGVGGADTMYGGDGNDTLYGGLDFDQLFGGKGDDILYGTQFGAILSTGGPCDIIQGGQGIDMLYVIYNGWVNSGTSQPVNVTIDISTGAGEVQVDGFRGENFSGIERLTFLGPDGDDHVTGANYDDALYGNGGDDIIRGKDGNDRIGDKGGFIDADGGIGYDTFELDLSATSSTNAVIDCRVGTITANGNDMGAFVNFEYFSIIASTGNDTLYGHDNGSSLIGWTGDDTIYGGSGNDSINGDKPIFFGGGNDEIHGGGGNDNIQDYNGNNILDGGAGNDSIVTVGIIDTITGGSGDDHLGWRVNVAQLGGSYDGGSGWDRLSLDVPTGTFDITGFDISRYEELAEYIFGGTFYTCILTTEQFSMFDSIHMPSGLATLALADNAAVVLPEWSLFGALQLANGGQTVDASGAGDNEFAPVVNGGDGNDTLISTDAEFEERFEFYGGDGNDRLLGGDTWEQSAGGAGNDRLEGAAGDDILWGDEGKDRLTGGGGDDHIDGGADADRLDGGGGFDDFVYDAASESTGKNFDTIHHFDIARDEIIVPFDILAIDPEVVGGTLSKATFNDDLKAAIGKDELGIAHAVFFTPDAGDYAGQTFVIIEANGRKGYQKNADYVILLEDANLEGLGLDIFN